MNEGAPPDLGTYRRVIEEAVDRIRTRDRNHRVVVEEVLLPDGRKELPLIGDQNTLYSIHFFSPFRFVFYVTTSSRTVAEYPGEMRVAGESISETEGAGAAAPGWSQVSVTAVPPEGAEILVVRLSRQGAGGRVYLDDLRLELEGRELDLAGELRRGFGGSGSNGKPLPGSCSVPGSESGGEQCHTGGTWNFSLIGLAVYGWIFQLGGSFAGMAPEPGSGANRQGPSGGHACLCEGIQRAFIRYLSS